MRIEAEKTNEVPLHTLSCGTLFKDATENFYIKSQNASELNEICEEKATDLILAVDVYSGQIRLFNKYYYVLPYENAMIKLYQENE